MKVKTQKKQIRKRSISDDFGLHPNNFSLLHSPGRQLSPFGKELFGSKLVPNGDFRDFTMEDDANSVGHWIFDKSYEREDKNKYIGSERGGTESVHYQSDFSAGVGGWYLFYLGVDQEAAATWNESLQALNLEVTVNGTTAARPSWGKIIPVVEDGGHYELVINLIINSGTFKIVGHLLGGGYTPMPWVLKTGENRRVITADGAYGSWALYTDGLNYLYNVDITSIELRKLPSKSLLPSGFSDDFEDEYTTDPSNPAYQNGGVLEFNGDDQHLQILAAQAEDFNPGDGSFTIEMWLKGDDTSRAYIWNKTGTHRISIRYYSDTGAGFLYFTTSDGIILNAAVFTPNNLPGVDWFHLAVVFNKTTGEAIAYKNAVPYSPIDISAWTGSCNPTGNLYIGAYSPSNNTFGGHMAEVRYSNVARTLDDIKTSYGAGKGWTFGAGFIAKDNDNFTQKLSANTTTSGIQPFDLEDGKLYKCGFKAKGYSGNANDQDIAMYTSLNPIIGYQSVGTDETWHEYNIYFAGDGGDSLNFYVNSGSQLAIDDVKVQELAIPQVTNFAEDLSPNGNHGLLKNDMELDQPQNPYSFNYNGTDQYIDFGDVMNSSLNDMLLFAWIKVTDVSAINVIMSANIGYGSNNLQWGIYNSSVYNMYLGTNENHITKTAYDGSIVGWENIWKFVAVTWDGSNVTMFEDSIQLNTKAAGNFSQNAQDNFQIGICWDYSHFNGYIGDAGIIIFDGTAGRPNNLPPNYKDWITRFYNKTKWKYKN